eukprot:GHVT01020955.1.p1 GENE.GHVT01020955.1~~GHVT01020955.1.p1  ORF type:complete len:574 (-),score=154.39 GHVT01020955.1:634-2355(-)
MAATCPPAQAPPSAGSPPSRFTELLHVNRNVDGWGPNPTDDATRKSCLANVLKYPFEPSLKPDRLGRVCDFTFSNYLRQLRDGGRGAAVPAAFAADMQFTTVDHQRQNKRPGGFVRRRPALQQTTKAFEEKKKQEEELKLGKKLKCEQRKAAAAQQARYARMHARQRTFTEWSVQPTPEWVVKEEIALSTLPKIKIDATKISVEDLCWRGTLCEYNRKMDKVSLKAPLPLQSLSSNVDFYWISAQDDDIIKDALLDEEKNIDVAATDQVLACLMSAAQSKYSWHLHLTKLDNKLLIDKTDGSIVDLITVNETAVEPPMQDDALKMNRPPALGIEAVKINQNFRQQVVKTENCVKHERPSFVEEGETPADVAYRYRIYTVPHRPDTPYTLNKKPIRIVTRAEVNGRQPEATGNDGLVYVCALNEHDPRKRDNWRTRIEGQKGALLAKEIRNNACKLKRFVATAMIAGCEDLRLGFVTRRNPTENTNHVILAVQPHKTADFAVQIGLKEENAWGVVRSIVDSVMNKPDGRYVLLKDPTQPILRLYARPDGDEGLEDDELPQDNAADKKPDAERNV